MILTDFPDFDVQAVASRGNAVLGIRDSGKSYTAVGLAERFHDGGIPFVALDPSGRWRWMRIPEVQGGKAYPVVVAGGLAQDLPLNRDNAAELMRAAMAAGVSIIFDLYDTTVSKADWRRIVRDVVHVLFYENEPHGLRHVFIEEAAEFCPQRINPGQGEVYAEIERLARMGGNARLGYTLINQRSAEVSKAVLELCDNLFLHRQKGKNSLEALEKWLAFTEAEEPEAIIATLPTLPQGECWAWMAGKASPVHVKVPRNKSAVPDRYAMRVELETHKPAVTGVDVAGFLERMREAMIDAGSDQDGNPPTLIEPAKRNMKKAPQAVDSRKPNETVAFKSLDVAMAHTAQAAERRRIEDVSKARAEGYALGYGEGYGFGYTEGLHDAYRNSATELKGALEELEARCAENRKKAQAFVKAGKDGIPAKAPAAAKAEAIAGVSEGLKNFVEKTRPDAEERRRLAGIEGGALGLLTVAVRHWPARLTWAQIAALAGRKAKGGHFNTSRNRLLGNNLVDDYNGSVVPTEAGFALAGGKPEQPATLEDAYLQALPGPADKMLRALLEYKEMTPTALATAINMLPRGGHWNLGLATLVRCDLIEKSGRTIKLRREALTT
jgi:uncharacterized protein